LAADAPLYYDAPDYLNVFVAADLSPLTRYGWTKQPVSFLLHVKYTLSYRIVSYNWTMFCCWVVNRVYVTLLTDQMYNY